MPFTSTDRNLSSRQSDSSTKPSKGRVAMKRTDFLHGFMGPVQTHFEQQIAYFKKEYDIIVVAH